MIPHSTRERKIAELLYDELTGRKPGVPSSEAEFQENAALALVHPPPVKAEGSSPDSREYRVNMLLREAQSLGYDVHPPSDRWGLAQRLAALVTKLEADLDELPKHTIPTPAEKIRGDLNHALNPVIGFLRLWARDFQEGKNVPASREKERSLGERMQQAAERIKAGLTIAENQLGFVAWSEEIKELRKEFGMGPR